MNAQTEPLAPLSILIAARFASGLAGRHFPLYEV
jgi:hypothetical protein